MSSSTAISATEWSATPVVAGGGVPLDEIAAVVRRRAGTLDSDLGPDVLVEWTLERFAETFGTTSCPLDLDGWIRRAMREIAGPARRTRDIDRSSVALARILEGLSTPVRSPALAKQRRLLLRRMSELIGGPECRVVLAMSTARSVDRVGAQLGLSPVDVASLQRRGMLRLQTQLDRRPELTRQLTEASRQPRRPRTNR